MSDNDKKIEKNEDKKENKNANNPFAGLWFWFVICFVVSFFANWFYLGGAVDTSKSNTIVTEAFVESIKESPYATVQKETTFRCNTFTPIFTKDGEKQYEVRFKDMKSDLYFSVIVPAAEVDELNNIEKDARYEGVVSYLYVDKAFAEATKDLEEDKKETRIIALLEGESEYAAFGTVSDINFMYSTYMTEYSIENATEYLDKYVDKIVNPPVEEKETKPAFTILANKS